MAKTQSLLNDDEDIWNFPVRPTVLEGEVRAGLKRALGGAPDVKPSPHGGGKKMGAALQDFLFGLGQVAGAPVASALTPAAPAINAALEFPIPDPSAALMGRPSVGTSLKDLAAPAIAGSNALGDALSATTGYDQKRSRELSGAGLLALLGPAAKAVPKFGGAVEGLLNKVGYTAKQDPTKRNTFLGMEHFREQPKIEDAYIKAADMRNAGVDLETIRQQTGWDINKATGSWRYEVSDDKMGLLGPYQELLEETSGLSTGDPGLILPLRKLIKHPELEKINPTLLDVAVRLKPKGQGGAFGYATQEESKKALKQLEAAGHTDVNAPRGLIDMGLLPLEKDSFIQFAEPKFGAGSEFVGKKFPTQKEFLDVLLHEIQHNAQQKSNGFSFGSALDGDPYWKNAGEVEARLAEIRRMLTAVERRDQPLSAGRLFGQDVPWSQQVTQPDTMSVGQGYNNWAPYRSTDKRKKY